MDTVAQERLVLQTARDLRKAVDERNEKTADAIASYDAAVADGDETQIKQRALFMIIIVGLVNPVSDVLKRYGETAELLKAAEQGEE